MNIGCCRLNLSVKSLTANLPCGLAELARTVYTPSRAFFVSGLPGLPAGHGQALCHRLVRLFAGVGGLDIGVSPAAPAGERGHPGKVPGAWTQLFGMDLPGSLPDF